MTDEEKAIANICKECGSYDFCIKNNQLHCAETVAYLKGLAEGRKEKWHDLREDPNDLPKENGYYWCKWNDGAYCTEHYFQDYGFGDYVIAWCEHPKFEE